MLDKGGATASQMSPLHYHKLPPPTPLWIFPRSLARSLARFLPTSLFPLLIQFWTAPGADAAARVVASILGASSHSSQLENPHVEPLVLCRRKVSAVLHRNKGTVQKSSTVFVVVSVALFCISAEEVLFSRGLVDAVRCVVFSARNPDLFAKTGG